MEFLGHGFWRFNFIKDLIFTTTKEPVRDQYKLLTDGFLKRMRVHGATHGSVDDEGELDQLLRNIK